MSLWIELALILYDLLANVMSTTVHYFKHSNRRGEYAIAYILGDWLRQAERRGWTQARQIYSRRTTPIEDEILSTMRREWGGRYASLGKLLEDEREILGAGSDEYKLLEIALSKGKVRATSTESEDAWDKDEPELWGTDAPPVAQPSLIQLTRAKAI